MPNGKVLKEKKSLYDVLNIKHDDDYNKLKENFLYYIIKVHPKMDEFDENSLIKFKNLIRAFEILKDKKLSKLYDEYLVNQKNGNFETLQKKINDINKKAEYLSKINYTKFIRHLQNEYKVLTPIRANTLIGLVYEEIEKDISDVENIDPEDIVPEYPLLKEILFEFSVFLTCFVIFVIFILIVVFIGG